MKQPLLILSFGLRVVCFKKKDEKITPALPITATYSSDVNLASTQQTIRDFGGATVFRPDLTDVMNISASNQNIKFNYSGATVPASFTPHITSGTKSLSIETAPMYRADQLPMMPASIVTTLVSVDIWIV